MARNACSLILLTVKKERVTALPTTQQLGLIQHLSWLQLMITATANTMMMLKPLHSAVDPVTAGLAEESFSKCLECSPNDRCGYCI